MYNELSLKNRICVSESIIDETMNKELTANLRQGKNAYLIEEHLQRIFKKFPDLENFQLVHTLENGVLEGTFISSLNVFRNALTQENELIKRINE